MPKRPCELCGAEVPPRFRYCRPCKLELVRERSRRWRLRRRARRLGLSEDQARTCRVCGFAPLPGKRVRYCSDACGEAAQAQDRAERVRRSRLARSIVLQLSTRERSFLRSAARIREMDVHEFVHEVTMNAAADTLAAERRGDTTRFQWDASSVHKGHRLTRPSHLQQVKS